MDCLNRILRSVYLEKSLKRFRFEVLYYSVKFGDETTSYPFS